MHTEPISLEAYILDPFELLKTRLREGTPASALWAAVLNWLCDIPTDPATTLILQGGQVLLRVSGETKGELISPLAEFLDQTGMVCEALGLTPDQTAAVVSHARHRLG
jgi:hypothetical protein